MRDMKTDFSDWLIVSDVDGTLNTKLRMLPERNLKAITHFVEDLGGNFTLASGRNVSSLRKHYERLPIKSTPAVILNGAGIYDYKHEKMLSFHSIDERGIDIVRRVNERFPLIQIEICTERYLFLIPEFSAARCRWRTEYRTRASENSKMSRRAIGARSYLWVFRRWFRGWLSISIL